MSLSALYLTRRAARLLPPRRVRHQRAAARRTARDGGLYREVRAPIYRTDDQGHQSWRPAPKIAQSLITPEEITDLGSLTAVAFAGSFEGQTTLAVGVRDGRPFRICVSSDQGYQHVILDIVR
jgi:hypothetical protein